MCLESVPLNMLPTLILSYVNLKFLFFFFKNTNAPFLPTFSRFLKECKENAEEVM